MQPPLNGAIQPCKGPHLHLISTRSLGIAHPKSSGNRPPRRMQTVFFPVIPALPAPTSASPSKKLTKRFTPMISRCSVPTLIRSIPESKTLFRAVSAPLAATGAGFPWMSAPGACATTIGRPFTLSAALRASPTFLPSPPLSRHPAIPSYPTLSGNVSFPGAASPFPTVWNGSSAIRATTSGAWRTLSACFTPVILPSSTNA